MGFLLLFGTGSEYINASSQIGSFVNIGIIIPVVLFLFLSTWLIGSGFSSGKFKIKSFEFVKFFIISLVTFATAAIFSLGSKTSPSNYITINGFKVPIGECIKGNRKIIPDEKERNEFCTCYAQKILNDPDLKLMYGTRLQNNDFTKVIKEIQESPTFLELGFENCLKSVTMEWTDKLANSMKESWEKQLTGTEFEQTNDIDQYCNCILKEYRKYPLSEIMKDEFSESSKAQEIDEMCTEESYKQHN